MFPITFGQTQINDIESFVQACAVLREQNPSVFEPMALYAVGSRLWMADLLQKPDLDIQTRSTLQAMLDEADCDVRFEPKYTGAQASVTPLTISQLRNTLLGTDDPTIESHANYSYQSLDVAVIAQRACIVNALDHRVDLKTNKKHFESVAHEAAYQRWLEHRVIETMGLRKYLDMAKGIRIETNFAVISFVERTLRSFVKPLKVGTFSLETALVLQDFLYDPSYGSLKTMVSTLITRRVNKDKKAEEKFRRDKEKNPNAEIESPKKLMPAFIKTPEDLYSIISAHVEKVCEPEVQALMKEYEELNEYIAVVPKTMAAYYQRKYQALMAFLDGQTPMLKSFAQFPEVKGQSINIAQLTGQAKYNTVYHAVNCLRDHKKNIMAVIDVNESIIAQLTELVIKVAVSKSITAPKETYTKAPKIRHLKKAPRKTFSTQLHPQYAEEDFDEYLKSAAAMVDGSPASITNVAEQLPVKAIIYVQEVEESYAALINIESESNRDKFIALLKNDKSLSTIMRQGDSSFLHVIAVLMQFHDKDEIKFYAKHVMKKCLVYRKVTELPIDAKKKDKLSMEIKIREYDAMIDSWLANVEAGFAEVIGTVNYLNYWQEALHPNVVYQTLARCTWINRQCIENIHNLVAVLRHLSHFYSVEACAKGLWRAVYADHHFYLKLSFPLVLKPFLDWLFIFNPFYTPNRPHLTFKEVNLMVKIFFPKYEMSKEMAAYIIKEIKKFESYHYTDLPSSHIESDIIAIKAEVESQLKNVNEIYALRENSINDPDMPTDRSADLFSEEAEELKLSQNLIPNIYHILYFLKNSKYCTESSAYQNSFYPIYCLLNPGSKLLIDPLRADSSKPAHLLNRESLDNILTALMLNLGHLGLSVTVHENPQMDDEEFNYAMGACGDCVRAIIAVAIAMSDNIAHQTELYVLYQYAKLERHTNLVFHKIFWGQVTMLSLQLNSERTSWLLDDEAQFRRQALVMMNAMAEFQKSENGADDESAPGKNAGLNHKMTI